MLTEHEQLVAAQAELAALKALQAASVNFRVSTFRAAGTNGPEDKGSKGGAVSVGGLGRFPVTLYGSQWEALIQVIPQLKDFLVANKDKLAIKVPSPTANGPVVELKK